MADDGDDKVESKPEEPEKKDAKPTSPQEPPAKKKTLLDLALSPFAEVKAGEGVSAILLLVNVFVLLTLYYFLKPVRGALMQGEYGDSAAEYISYASAGQAILLIPVVIAYGWIAKRVSPIKLITIVTLFFASNLVIFYVLARAGAPIALAYFIWLGIFNNTVIAQFWAFANDTYSPEQGKRLFAIVGIGGSFGAIAGSGIVKAAKEVVTTNDLLLLAMGGLLMGLGLTWAVHKVTTTTSAPEPTRAAEATGKPAEGLGGPNGFVMLLSDPYLLFIGIATLLLNLVNTNGEFILNQALEPAARAAVAAGEAPDVKEFSKNFYNDYYLYVNVIGFAVQSLLVSRILKYVGVRWAMFIVPALALGAYTTLAVVPLLAAIRVAKIAENAADYSVQNTTKQAFWLITTREQKYKAKAAVDTFLVRIGDLASAGTVAAGTALAFSMTHFAIVNVVVVLGWLGV
ncbi:MAG: hypothetical protein IT379_33965, partial [Deltaproteobacteria bacterium]|nr:hypothetical protein [Deltaproteobacteria bacterium]